jgi:FkbM family methyltransferase
MLSPRWFGTGDDLVVGKPTAQSSTCRQEPTGKVRSDDETNGYAMLPTEVELNPWWQVDLLDQYRIDEVRIFNDPAAPSRLRFFTLLLSLDGIEWRNAYVKKNNQDVGLDDGGWRIKLRSNFHARHIRLRLDGYDRLRFARLQAFGSVATGPVSSAGGLPPARSKPEVVNIDDLNVFLDRENYSDILIDALASGRYEQRERKMLISALSPGDRVVEVGTALGVVTMLAARIIGPENIVTFDGNPQMIEHARRNFDSNGLGRIHAQNAVLQNVKKWKGSDQKVDFFISRNFWASGLSLNASMVAVVSVPVRCFEQVIAEHNANVLICDIEGGEIELLMDADLAKIDTIMMEVHYSCGEVAANRLIRRLINSGFSIDLRASASCVVLLHRGFRLKKGQRRSRNLVA